MAAPNSVGLSPAKLPTPRSGLVGTNMSFGTLFAGGIDATGAATTDVDVYNAFNHAITSGLAMPAARTGIALSETNDIAVLYGGSDGTAATVNGTGTLWEFDSTVPPNGSYTTVTDDTDQPRTDQIMITANG